MCHIHSSLEVLLQVHVGDREALGFLAHAPHSGSYLKILYLFLIVINPLKCSCSSWVTAVQQYHCSAFSDWSNGLTRWENVARLSRPSSLFLGGSVGPHPEFCQPSLPPRLGGVVRMSDQGPSSILSLTGPHFLNFINSG